MADQRIHQLDEAGGLALSWLTPVGHPTYLTASISNTSNDNPVVVTATSHGYSTGDEIYITGVGGQTELNSRTFTITVVNANSFSLNGEDGSGQGTYSGGGTAIRGRLQMSPLSYLGLAHGVCQGRLTTESGVAVSTSDRTSQSTIYWTPFNGNRIALYDGSRWKIHTFTERSLALSGLTSGKNYDVFLYDNSGTLTLELSAAWTNDNARADALTTQDGIHVKSGAATRRYIGTIRTTGTTTTESSVTKRFVWNMYNRAWRTMRVVEATNSWTYTTNSYRQTRASTANQVEFVRGLNEDRVIAAAFAYCDNSSVGMLIGTGIGLDSTTVNSASVYAGTTAGAGFGGIGNAIYEGHPSIGYHKLVWLERSGQTSGTTTWYGTAGTTILQTGMFGGLLA